MIFKVIYFEILLYWRYYHLPSEVEVLTINGLYETYKHNLCTLADTCLFVDVWWLSIGDPLNTGSIKEFTMCMLHRWIANLILSKFIRHWCINRSYTNQYTHLHNGHSTYKVPVILEFYVTDYIPDKDHLDFNINMISV